jgi:hypothetical protein
VVYESVSSYTNGLGHLATLFHPDLNKPKFELADQTQTLAFEQTAEVFFQDILSMDYWNVLITDESAVSDFSFCGDFPDDLLDERLPRKEQYGHWLTWFRNRVTERYGIEIAETGTVFLVDLFRMIEVANKAKLPLQ